MNYIYGEEREGEGLMGRNLFCTLCGMSRLSERKINLRTFAPASPNARMYNKSETKKHKNFITGILLF